jgi:aminopeptidase N
VFSIAKSWEASEIDIDTSNERATLTFAEEIPSTQPVVLTIDFKGTINNSMAGFYRSKYKPTVTPSPGTAKQGEDYYMFSTQFEACDARRAFPCFDEPNLKTPFEFEIEIPEDQTALSNMPEKGTRKGNRAGTKVVSFEKTPAMSTYVRDAPSSIIRNLLIHICSLLHGRLATLNMSKDLLIAITTGKPCQCEYTPQKG